MKTVNIPIPNKEAVLEECRIARNRDFAPFPGTVTGLYYFKGECLQEMFKEHLERYGVKVKITRGWAHFMSKGANRASHQHTSMTGLYYLHIPECSSEMIMTDTDEAVPPIEDDFMMFEAMRPHKITTHEDLDDRWAIAFECELVGQ